MKKNQNLLVLHLDFSIFILPQMEVYWTLVLLNYISLTTKICTTSAVYFALMTQPGGICENKKVINFLSVFDPSELCI